MKLSRDQAGRKKQQQQQSKSQSQPQSHSQPQHEASAHQARPSPSSPQQAQQCSLEMTVPRFGTISPLSHRLLEPVVEFPTRLKADLAEVASGLTNSSLGTTNVADTMMVTPQPQLSTVPVTTTASPAAWSDSRKSWSGLFEATAVTPLSSSGYTGLPNGLSTQQSTRPQSPTRQTRVSLGEESMLLLTPMNGDHDLPEIILTWRSLQPVRPTCPRGLTNYGNMCFLNAILQSLLHCPPLINMFFKLRERLELVSPERAPFLRAMNILFAEHDFEGEPVAEDSQTHITTPPPRGGSTVHSPAFSPPPPSPLPPVTPEALYDCIKSKCIGSAAFQGAQEDAQEFLTFLLDQLHEELLACKSLIKWRFTQQAEEGDHKWHGHGSHNYDSRSNGQEWMEVGPGQRLSVARTLDMVASPISFLFFGRYRSVVQRARAKDSITVEPFHCLSLPVEEASIGSVEDALMALIQPEQIDKGRLVKRISIEGAPPVLVLHLKRFIYRQGVEKLGKFIAYPDRLELARSVLPIVASGRTAPIYRLFAVIYHHGRGADGGHYSCHVRQSLSASDPWIFYDDATWQRELPERVFANKGPSQTAYLLMYIRAKEK